MSGVGKTLLYTYGSEVMRAKLGCPYGVTLVCAPLTVLQTQKMAECPEDMIMLTMAGQLRGGKGSDPLLLGGLDHLVGR